MSDLAGQLDNLVEELREGIDEAKHLSDGRRVDSVVKRLENQLEQVMNVVEKLRQDVNDLSSRVANLELARG